MNQSYYKPIGKNSLYAVIIISLLLFVGGWALSVTKRIISVKEEIYFKVSKGYLTGNLSCPTPLCMNLKNGSIGYILGNDQLSFKINRISLINDNLYHISFTVITKDAHLISHLDSKKIKSSIFFEDNNILNILFNF